MQKKRRILFIRGLSFLEIFLLISLSFAFSFILSQNFVKAQSANELLTNSMPSSMPIGSQTNSGAEEIAKLLPKLAPPGVLEGGDPKANAGAKIPEETTKPGTGSEGLGIMSFIKKLYTGGIGGPAGALVAGAAWGLTVAALVQVVGGMFGADKKTLNALSLAVIGGSIGGGAISSLLQYAGKTKFLGLSSSTFSVLSGIGIGAAIFILTYKSEKKRVVTFQCMPFEPLLGGAKCEECNKDPFRPCSEYRCKSLGQACQLLNPGTGEEKCAWVNPKDVNSPTIQPWTSALSPSNLGLKYSPDTSIRPPNRGVKIVTSSGSGCLPAFTPLQFGLLTNEPAQCKIDYNHTKAFEEMKYYVGETNYFLYNHTQLMRLPGPDSATGDLTPEIENDGSFSLYTRCIDANGNQNVDEYVFNFCVDQGPDTTPPIIEATSITSGSPVQYNADKVPIEVYTNEPSECKWSIQSKDYSEMENVMSCSTKTFQVNSDLRYTCSGTLTGIKNKEDNKFYFRCKDNPEKADNQRNVNVQSYELILKGSQPLNIVETSPNETIFGSTETVSVDLQLQTDDGADEGKSICFFSPTSSLDSFIAMFETNNYLHKQTLSLTSGSYTYYFRCIDAGGNAAESSTSFSVFVDKQAPQVTRAYKQDALKIVTDENAECAYSLNSCNFVFKDGIKMIYSTPDIKSNHYAEWKPNSIYYIKCRDAYGNEPSPNACSITVSAVQLSKE